MALLLRDPRSIFEAPFLRKPVPAPPTGRRPRAPV